VKLGSTRRNEASSKNRHVAVGLVFHVFCSLPDFQHETMPPLYSSAVPRNFLAVDVNGLFELNEDARERRSALGTLDSREGNQKNVGVH
jgi:hypothetical protein